jgi:hypothetical protein
MSDTPDRFPRRDDDGRAVGLADLIALTLGYLLLTAVLLVIIDGLTAMFGWGTFGSSNGWFTLILPAWLFILEEFRAWRPVHGRLALALSGGVVAIGLGLGVATLVADLPPLLSGGTGAAVASVAYALYWYHGVRWLARREGSIT